MYIHTFVQPTSSVSFSHRNVLDKATRLFEFGEPLFRDDKISCFFPVFSTCQLMIKALDNLGGVCV